MRIGGFIHRGAVMGVTVLCVAMAIAAPPRGGDAGRKKPPSSSQPDPLEALRALYVELPEVTLDGLPLDEFAEWLRRQTQVNVVMRWHALEKEGVTKETPVTLRMKKAVLYNVLTIVLDRLGEDHETLGFRATDNMIIVSTRADLDRSMVTKTYDVHDLLLEIPNFEAMRPAAMDGPNRRAARDDSAKKVEGADDSVQQLIDVITTSVFPNSWKVNGGTGTIKFFNGHLIVRNTPEAHEILRGTFRLRSGK